MTHEEIMAELDALHKQNLKTIVALKAARGMLESYRSDGFVSHQFTKSNTDKVIAKINSALEDNHEFPPHPLWDYKVEHKEDEVA